MPVKVNNIHYLIIESRFEHLLMVMPAIFFICLLVQILTIDLYNTEMDLSTVADVTLLTDKARGLALFMK